MQIPLILLALVVVFLLAGSSKSNPQSPSIFTPILALENCAPAPRLIGKQSAPFIFREGMTLWAKDQKSYMAFLKNSNGSYSLKILNPSHVPIYTYSETISASPELSLAKGIFSIKGTSFQRRYGVSAAIELGNKGLFLYINDEMGSGVEPLFFYESPSKNFFSPYFIEPITTTIETNTVNFQFAGVVAKVEKGKGYKISLTDKRKPESPLTITSLQDILKLSSQPGFGLFAPPLLYAFFYFAEYPYLRAEDLLDVGTELDQYGYLSLLRSWLLYYNPIQKINQSSRLGPIFLEEASDTFARLYNFSTSEGLNWRERSEKNKCFALQVADETCNVQFFDGDIYNQMVDRGYHPENDMCRVIFSDLVAEPQKNKCKALGFPALTQRNHETIVTQLQPRCAALGKEFLSENQRACCARFDSDYCKYLESLFTKNGNCSCFLDPKDLVSDLLPGSQVSGVSGSCYADCDLQKFNQDEYKIVPCTSNICISNNRNQFDITKSKVDIVMNDLFCCQGVCTLPESQKPARPKQTIYWVVGAVTVLVVLSVIAFLFIFPPHAK